MKWENHTLKPPIQIRINNTPPILSFSLKQEIETIWLVKKQSHPKLFNGRVFTVEQLESDFLTGYWTEYKTVLAQMEKPELYHDLLIRPLAINGLIHCPEGFVLGKREESSVYLANYWQSPPAGSVEYRHEEKNIDLIQQLYHEAEEELGLNAKLLDTPRIITATEHEHTHIIDVGILLETQLSFDAIYQYWQKNANPEYSDLFCLPIAEQAPENTLPTTHFLINNWHQQ